MAGWKDSQLHAQKAIHLIKKIKVTGLQGNYFFTILNNFFQNKALFQNSVFQLWNYGLNIFQNFFKNIRKVYML